MSVITHSSWQAVGKAAKPPADRLCLHIFNTHKESEKVIVCIIVFIVPISCILYHVINFTCALHI